MAVTPVYVQIVRSGMLTLTLLPWENWGMLNQNAYDLNIPDWELWFSQEKKSKDPTMRMLRMQKRNSEELAILSINDCI